MPNFSRRDVLKILIGLSSLLVLAPLAGVTRYLNIPYVFKPVKVEVAGASTMPDNSALDFQWPTDTRPFDSNLLIRDNNGNYCAFNRVCTHLQCFVNYDPSTGTIQCPCHGSRFDAHTGEVLSGPAPRALPEIVLESDPNGDVYAINAVGQFGVGRTEQPTKDHTARTAKLGD